jgi:hypothetical protein
MPIEHWASLKCPRNCGPNRYNAHIQFFEFLNHFQVFWIRMGRIAPEGCLRLLFDLKGLTATKINSPMCTRQAYEHKHHLVSSFCMTNNNISTKFGVSTGKYKQGTNHLPFICFIVRAFVTTLPMSELATILIICGTFYHFLFLLSLHPLILRFVLPPPALRTPLILFFL